MTWWFLLLLANGFFAALNYSNGDFGWALFAAFTAGIAFAVVVEKLCEEPPA